MEKFTVIPQSSLEKIFPDAPLPEQPYTRASALQGELFSYQLVLKKDGWAMEDVTWKLDAPAGCTVQVFQVETVPCQLAAYPTEDRHDDDYLTLKSGLFPDVLRPLEKPVISVSAFLSTCLWIDVQVSADCPAGDHALRFTLTDSEGTTAESTFTLHVVPAALPEQKLLFTQWFHVDCLATYYKVPIYSEEHWTIIENFLREAVRHGMNVVLTPVLTPALDTAVGTERPCTQLVEIEKSGENYAFDFSRLERFVKIALSCGVTRFEMSHLFSQWGATCAPNIYVTENGVRSLRFGWHTPSDGEDYVNFLKQFLPAVIRWFTEQGLLDRVLFHISDEPRAEHLAMYEKHVALVRSLIGDLPAIDALSSPEYYDRGLVKCPVPATSHIEEFLRREIPGLWAYYCCGQSKDVGNRFLAMPSHRNRILGLQMWKFHIAGFLHWGYNFWYSQYSKYEIDPFRVTDAGGGFPGGDAFSVYPGEDGRPLASLRLKVFCHALQDMRALALLESLSGREAAEALVPGYEEITFSRYPRTASYLLELREKVNAAIEAKWG